MVHSDSHFAFIASDKTRFDQYTRKSGGLFKKTVTTYIDGYVKPQWFVASFIEAQPDGGISAICVKDIGATTGYGNTTSCDDPAHLATSMVSIKEWKGGNMPEIEEKAYAWVHKKSSFTVLAFTILTFIVTYGAMSAFAGAMGVGASGASVGLSSLQGAAIGAGVYAGVNILSGASLTEAQAGWAGNTGNGVLQVNSGSQSEHQRNLNAGIRNKQTNSRVGTGLQGVSKVYKGNCTDETMTKKQCIAAGLDPGQMHRADSFHEVNIVKQMRIREAECKQEKPNISKAVLQKCAAGLMASDGSVTPWTVDTGQ